MTMSGAGCQTCYGLDLATIIEENVKLKVRGMESSGPRTCGVTLVVGAVSQLVKSVSQGKDDIEMVSS